MKHLLVIDDDRSILELIRNALRKDGYLVTACQSAAEADMQKLPSYDLILLDVMMPGIDGFEYCKKIRNMVDCPILFLTAKTLEEDILCVLLTTRFSKHLRSQLAPLFTATEEVAMQNLDFEIGHSKIREFEDVLERAILNIVNNALDYAKQDGLVKIQFQGENDTLQITVTDDGKGFSENALRHAKEQFYMEDQSRNSHMHFGMGLYIASCIAQQHGGEIRLENSAETGGAMVTICVQS